MAIDILARELRQSGEAAPEDSTLKEWLKKRAEKSLWFFSRWILGNEFLGRGTFHRDVMCPFLTNLSSNRLKLMMVPMGHLKTTVVSRSMPLHMLIQPQRGNLYFKGMAGTDTCILLCNENESKSKENLAVSREHLEGNEWIYWLWPQVCWESPRTQARAWSDTDIVIPRTLGRAEPSIKAVGIKTGFVGSYWDAILPDDIAALQAAQDPPTMERAKKWLRAAKTRRRAHTLFIGVGTHWGANDVYVAWRKDPDFEVLIKSIIEFSDDDKHEYALWPENPKYEGKPALEAIEKLRQGTDPIEWALWFMNKPVPSGFTALEWNDLREYRFSEDMTELRFEESKADEVITQRFHRIAKNMGFVLGSPFDPRNAARRTKPPFGMGQDFFDYMRLKYPEKAQDDEPVVGN